MMDDYDLLSFGQIKKLVRREIGQERFKIEPKRQKKIKIVQRKPVEQEFVDFMQQTDKKFAFNSKELFYGYKKPVTKQDLQSLGYYIKGVEKEECLGEVFAEFVIFLIKEVIVNNLTLAVPAIGAYCTLHTKPIEGEDFKKYRQQGKFLDINFLISDFKAYKIVLTRYRSRDSSIFFDTDIALDPGLQKELSEQINSGKQYYDSIPKKFDDYISEFWYLYPKASLKFLKSFIRFGWVQIFHHAKRFRDVFIQTKNHYIYIGNIETLSGFKPETYYRRLMRKKLEKLFITKNIKWDGYYYFCISQQEYKYYFKPTENMKKLRRYNSCRANTTKYFFFDNPKVLFKHPDMAYAFYKYRYMVRAKAPQDFGNHRYIRPYLPIQNVENYEFVGAKTLKNLMEHKYKILCLRKQR